MDNTNEQLMHLNYVTTFTQRAFINTW